MSSSSSVVVSNLSSPYVLFWDNLFFNTRNAGLLIFGIVVFKPVLLDLATTLREIFEELTKTPITQGHPFAVGFFTGLFIASCFFVCMKRDLFF